VLSTINLLIREFHLDDLDKLLIIYNDEINMRYIPNASHNWSMEDLEKKYRKYAANYSKGYGLYVIEELKTGHIMGEAGLFNTMNDENCLELGYIIDHRYCGEGYGTEVCMALINYCFQHLQRQQVIARMYKQNGASVRLAEKCGMQLESMEEVANGIQVLQYTIMNTK